MKKLVLLALLLITATAALAASQKYYEYPDLPQLKDSDRVLVYQNLSGSRNITGAMIKSTALAAAQPQLDVLNAKTTTVLDTNQKNKFNKATVRPGYEVYPDGTIINDARSVNSAINAPISVTGQKFVTVSGFPPSATWRYYVFYAYDGTTITGQGYIVTVNAASIAVPAGSSWFVINVKYRDPAVDTFDAVQVEYGTAKTDYEAYAARETIRYIGGVEVFTPSPAVSEVTNGPLGKNLFNPATVMTGVEVYPSGAITAQADSVISDYIYVKDHSSLYVSGLQTNPGMARYYVFYGADKNTITGTGNIAFGSNAGAVTVPAGSYWFRSSIKQRNAAATDLTAVQIEFNTGVTAYEAHVPGVILINGIPLPSLENVPFKRNPSSTAKNFLLFGDSITETATVTAEGAYTEGTRQSWPVYAKGLLQMASMKNYAKGGSAYKDQYPDGFQRVSYQITKAFEHGLTADVVVISAGTNDGVANLGDYATAMGKTTLASLDRLLLYEALRWEFWSIRANWPTATCFVVLPIQRPDVTTASQAALYTAIKTMAAEYNFIIIDATWESGIVRQFEVPAAAGRYLSDGVHPNTAGQQLLANYISARINNALNY